MKLTIQEIDALMSSLQVMSAFNQKSQEQKLNIQYSDIYKKLENYRYSLTS